MNVKNEKDKKSFLVYIDQAARWADFFNDEGLGKLFRAIIIHERAKHDGEAVPSQSFEDRGLAFAFKEAITVLDRNTQRWIEISNERKKAGHKGGIASGKSRNKHGRNKQTKQMLHSFEIDHQNMKQTKQVNQMLHTLSVLENQASTASPSRSNEANEADKDKERLFNTPLTASALEGVAVEGEAPEDYEGFKPYPL